MNGKPEANSVRANINSANNKATIKTSYSVEYLDIISIYSSTTRILQCRLVTTFIENKNKEIMRKNVIEKTFKNINNVCIERNAVARKFET